MIAALIAAALATGGLSELKREFPGATVVEARGSGRVTHVSGFHAPGLAASPRDAALAFLWRYPDAFGLSSRQDLVDLARPARGEAGAVRFQRRIGGRPVFDGDLVVGLDANGAVILVNGTDVPPKVTGACRVSREQAIAAARRAIPRLQTQDAPRAAKGWKAVGGTLRPVWRVELIAKRPPGDWVSYVDGVSGEVLLRTDLRTRS